MSTTIQAEHFTKALHSILDETFDNVHGHYLDKGDSLFETLVDITAAEASIPVGGKCATLAAQVKHVAFYLDTLEKSMRDANYPRVDWDEIWRTVGSVTPDEWVAIKNELRASYTRVLQLMEDIPTWDSEEVISNIIDVIAHTAYHLGEIRQALCTLKP